MSDNEPDLELDLEEEYDSNDDIEMAQLESLVTDVEDYKYKILSPDKIVSEMIEKIKSVNLILLIPSTTARILLHHFKWDEEKLLEDYFSKDRAAIFKAAGLVDPSSVSKSKELPSDSTEFCGICLSPFIRSLMTGLECGHRFCGDCWAKYLSVKVMSEGECLSISCPAHKCEILVDDTSAMALIKDSTVRSKYQCLITQSFVECNRLLKWCPAPDCNRAVKVQEVEFKPVKCVCGRRFCFKCSETWHAPILCEYLRKWVKTAAEDSATSHWIGINTKECPKCHTAIEKNGGCNHMTCRKCKYEFCWICSVNWAHHNVNYSCNRFESAEAQNEQMINRSKLNRILFYYDRYVNYKKSFEKDNDLCLIIGETITKFQALGMSWMEVQFLTRALEALRQCRVTLMYSYPFAYYIEPCNQMDIFVDNQRDLEIATEELAQYLERELQYDSVVEVKQKVRDKTAYCEDRRKVLLDHVHEGYDKDWWKDNSLA
ncbi:E3 ubiquitin-protein ligase ARIH1-like [Cotesia glomerata]|uniref:E3 ubiquitin-protein ligase ARIH1-like n=1 Tax=Cotesia glomerata TaxID=32391 RepID=UPI001D00E125|nr:E3 ubiquitin-protein ligase ARIH1-like [Cotesia glomerata]